MMVAAALNQLLVQFAALGSCILMLAALSKLKFIQTLWRINVKEPFENWMKHQLQPTNDRITETHDRLYELADTLDYQFKSNGGNSLRDRVDAAVHAVGGQPTPSKETQTSVTAGEHS